MVRVAGPSPETGVTEIQVGSEVCTFQRRCGRTEIAAVNVSPSEDACRCRGVTATAVATNGPTENDSGQLRTRYGSLVKRSSSPFHVSDASNTMSCGEG